MSVLLLLTTAAAWAAPANVLSWDATTKTLTITETATGAIATTSWPFTIGTETINKTDVEHLVIGDGVTEIMNGTFENCTNLITAIISNSVTSIGSTAFKNCTSLTTINLPCNEYFSEIKENTFYSCTSLTSIDIPNNVTTIERFAFWGAGLTSFPTMNGVMTIGYGAFEYCTGLTSVSIPPSVTNIGQHAFWGCEHLTTVRIYNMEPSTETEPGVYSESGIHPRAFPLSVRRIIIPSVVTSITESNLTIFSSIRESFMVDICYEGPKSGCDQLFGKTYQINWEEKHQEPLDKFGLTQASVHWLCTATFDMQGVLPNPAPQTVYSHMDEVQCELPQTAQGYDFGGWYRDKNCTQTFINIVESVTTYGRTIPCDVTIYAKWRARTDNVITFDTNGKGTIPASQKLISGMKVGVPNGQSINEGGVDYVIGGWYTDQGCTDLYDFSTEVNHSMTLYAKWVEATGHANITVNDGGSVRLTDAIGQAYYSTSPIVPGIYTLTVKPKKGKSFTAEYTLTDRSSGVSESLQTFSANKLTTRTLDLTTKDADITVTFSNNPVVSVTVSTDGIAEAGTYTMKDGHKKTFEDGSVVTAYGDASQPADAITLTINKDAGVGCALTIVNNGQKSQRTTDTSNYGFTPHGNVTIELFFYDTTSGMIELANDADNSSALSTADGKKRMVTLSGRTLKRDGNWNTLCLPFDFDITGSVLDKTGMTLKELDTETADNGHLTGLEGSTLYLNFKSAGTQIKAGKPYIIKWTKPSSYSSSKDITDPVFGAVTIDNSSPESVTSADGNVTFAGQYSPFSIVESGATGDNQGNINEILLLAAGNKLGYSQNPRTLHSFRCHFYVPTNGTTAAHSFVVDFGEGETTEIETITNNQYPETITNNQYPITDGAWYTIDGRKLTGKPTAKGIYIVNGKKVIVK